MDEFDRKEMARQRRMAQMAAMWDGHDYRTRWVPPKDIYKRRPKHRPQNAHDWEELED